MTGWQADSPQIVLASASTARRTLLDRAGLRFMTAVAAIDETEVKRSALAMSASPDDTAMLLADLKAERVMARYPDALVVGGDQLLVCEGRWFDKPADLEDARAQLLALRGRTHELVTAVTCWRGGRAVWHHIARPRLTMRMFSEDFLAAYLLAEGDVLTGTVGAYRFEGCGVQLFESVIGEHAAILGLPLLPLLGFLRQHGVLL